MAIAEIEDLDDRTTVLSGLCSGPKGQKHDREVLQECFTNCKHQFVTGSPELLKSPIRYWHIASPSRHSIGQMALLDTKQGQAEEPLPSRRTAAGQPILFSISISPPSVQNSSGSCQRQPPLTLSSNASRLCRLEKARRSLDPWTFPPAQTRQETLRHSDPCQGRHFYITPHHRHPSNRPYRLTLATSIWLATEYRLLYLLSTLRLRARNRLCRGPTNTWPPSGPLPRGRLHHLRTRPRHHGASQESEGRIHPRDSTALA